MIVNLNIASFSGEFRGDSSLNSSMACYIGSDPTATDPNTKSDLTNATNATKAAVICVATAMYAGRADADGNASPCCDS